MKFLLLLICCISWTANANFLELSKQFFEKNIKVEQAYNNVLKADESIKIVESLLSTQLNTEISYLDNNSDAANAVNFAAGKTTALKLNLSKSTSWGGVFSFNNSFEKVIQDPSRIRIFGGDPEIHQFKQSLSFSTSLTRNLFGSEFDLNLNKSILNAEYVDSISKVSVNNLFLQFGMTYAQAILNKKLFSLQEEALKRALKRLALVQRRVSDGINLKSDLYRAEAAKYIQEEQLDLAKQDLNSSLLEMTNLLHRSIVPADLGLISELNSVLDKMPKKNDEILMSVDAQKKLSEQLELDRDLKNNGMLPDMNFSVSYQTNDYDPNSSKVFDRGNLAGKKNTLTVGVNFNYNFGRVSERANLAQSEINYNQALHQLSAETISSSEKVSILKNNIELSLLNIGKAKKRVELSNAVITEYIKLFSLGKITLDQVIQAEEDLIASERNLARQMTRSFMLKLELISLNNYFPELIEGEIE